MTIYSLGTCFVYTSIGSYFPMSGGRHAILVQTVAKAGPQMQVLHPSLDGNACPAVYSLPSAPSHVSSPAATV